MPENTDMGSRMYEHYLRYGKTKKKLKRKTFMKRYGYGLKRKKTTRRTSDVERQLRRSLSKRDIAGLRD